MGPIRNPGEDTRARLKASTRYVTLIDNIFQGIFTKRLFECELGAMTGNQSYRKRTDQVVRLSIVFSKA
jgi:hypothetical protein